MTQPATPPAVPTPPATPAAPAQPAAAAPQMFVVNGTSVTDPTAIQTHIMALETFRTETIASARAEFVEALAKDNKLPATQIAAMTEFAQSLSPEQFTKWKASQDAAPAMTLTGNHGTNPGETKAPEAVQTANEALEIRDLEQIVSDHLSTGMSQERLETKASWKRLQELKNKQASAS